MLDAADTERAQIVAELKTCSHDATLWLKLLENEPTAGGAVSGEAREGWRMRIAKRGQACCSVSGGGNAEQSAAREELRAMAKGLDRGPG